MKKIATLFVVLLAFAVLAVSAIVEVAMGQIALVFAIVVAIGIGLAVVITTVRSPLLFMQVTRFLSIALMYAITTAMRITSQFVSAFQTTLNKSLPIYDNDTIGLRRHYGHDVLTDDTRGMQKEHVGILPHIVVAFWQRLTTRRYDDATDYGFRTQHCRLTGLTLGFT